MIDNFANAADAVHAPATRSFAITPSGSETLPLLPKGVYVGQGGTIAMRGSGDSAPTTWIEVPSGALVPFRAAYVLATGTTAGNLVGID